MQGRKDHQAELFSYLDLEALVPKQHLLRRIDRAVDLAFVRELSRSLYSDGMGRPSIDPEVFFRIQLIGYIYGIESERQLVEEVRLNLAYRWFCRLSLEDQVMDHSSLTRIRDRLGEKFYEQVFSKVVEQCCKAGLVRGKRAITDATLIRADASLDSLERRDGEEDDQYPRGRKLSNETHVSRSDYESTLVSRQNGPKQLCHKVHYVADSKKRVITGVSVTTGARPDYEVLPQQLDYCRSTLGLNFKKLVADKGYGRGKIYEYLKHKGILAYVPPTTDRMSRHREFGFKYLSSQQAYQCPRGTKLHKRRYEPAVNRSVYFSKAQDCRDCPDALVCPAAKTHDSAARRMYRTDYEQYIEPVRRRERSFVFRSMLIERKWKIEGIFAEAKMRHGLGRAKYRGLTKLAIQAYMTATTQNLKRLVADLNILLEYLRRFHQIGLNPHPNYNVLR